MFKFFQRLGTDPKKKLLKTLGSFNLPTFPGIVLKVLDAIRAPDASPSSVASVLSSDPGLSVRLLRLVNSSGFAARNKVESVNHAVALLGMSAVESMVLSVGAKGALPDQPARGFDPVRYWRAAARRAAAARRLAGRLHPARAAESFTAGLLQDMAVPLLAHSQAAEYGAVLEAWHGGEGDLAELERAKFGWDHPQVATWICNEWALPEPLAAAIGAHHEGPKEEMEEIPAVTLVSCVREGDDKDGLEKLVETAHAKYGLSKDEANEAVEQAGEESEALAQAFA